VIQPPQLPPPLPPAARRPARAASSRYLRHKDLARLRNLLFAARAVVEGFYSGRHKSALKGHSPEFIEYRRYTPGDPPSSIDWKAYARSDRYYIKVTEKETDMNCHLLVDSSASMKYTGSTPLGLSKLNYASLLAASMAYLIVRQGDKVSLTRFNDKLTAHVPLGGTFAHLYRLVHSLEAGRPGGVIPISRALRLAHPLLAGKGLLVVISDFYDDPAQLFRALALYTHRRFDVLLLHLLHEEEAVLPDVPHACFLDSETGDRVVCHTADVRREYETNLNAFMHTLRSGCRARRIDYVPAHTGMPYEQVLRQCLARRAGP
jgi:uncharacterized protein (DUF58 family)